jgi:hypothetical protein
VADHLQREIQVIGGERLGGKEDGDDPNFRQQNHPLPGIAKNNQFGSESGRTESEQTDS